MTLPEPARELWLRTRRIISESLEELTGEEQGYRIGGGTILAARWQHRRSEDIDLTVDADWQREKLRQESCGSTRATCAERQPKTSSYTRRKRDRRGAGKPQRER